MILAIIAAGGMFGEMLQATGMGKNLGGDPGRNVIGNFFSFFDCRDFKNRAGLFNCCSDYCCFTGNTFDGKSGFAIIQRNYPGYFEHGCRKHDGEPCQ